MNETTRHTRSRCTLYAIYKSTEYMYLNFRPSPVEDMITMIITRNAANRTPYYRTLRPTTYS